MNLDEFDNQVMGMGEHRRTDVASTLATAPTEAGWRPTAGRPDDGHQFHFAVHIQGSYRVGDGPHIDAPAPAPLDEPFTVTVRAWNLAAACTAAASLPLNEWTHEAVGGQSEEKP